MKISQKVQLDFFFIAEKQYVCIVLESSCESITRVKLIINTSVTPLYDRYTPGVPLGDL